MTKKEKLERFDAVMAERDTLRLAVYDMVCPASKFSFVDRVRVDVARDIDGDFEGSYSVSVSRRAMPYYMVESRSGGKVSSVSFYTENEIQDEQENTTVFWRMMRHAVWQIKRLQVAA